ncbi:exported hypothetical protein [Candidatus Sulfopaludibacter sp. SbA3]|nr:exported hypothetical protein [Candidatus Sulfopaludibacter sp. SbA3]
MQTILRTPIQYAMLLAAALPLAVAQSGTAQAGNPTFHAETRLSMVHFHVVQGQRFIGGVKLSDLDLQEDGVSKPITILEGGGTQAAATPFDLILLFDESPSVMNADLLSPLLFQQKLLQEMPNVRLAVYGFSKSLRKYTEPTRDFAQLSTAFEALRTGQQAGELIPLALFPKRKAGTGQTWLYEAVRGAAEDASQPDARILRSMLVFSDGLGTTTAEPQDAASVCESLGIPVYPVVLGHRRILASLQKAERALSAQPNPPVTRNSGKGSSTRDPSPAASRRVDKEEAHEKSVERFGSLGEMTGGRNFDPPEINLDVLQKVLEGMSVLMRTDYVAGFSPEANSGTPHKHRIEVKLRNLDVGKIVGGKRETSY